MSVAVRPEKLSLNSEIKEGNNIKGRVEEVIYIGTDTHYGVRFPGGQKARVREQNITQARRVIATTGDEVTVSFTRISPQLLID
ncbi:MAG: TOBE domain-containing protein [Chloroflexota bacterium]|nr:TOBE domain-containing protein [Chloroflexota bacterium]